MKKTNCINTRKASALMKAFLNQASDLQTTGSFYPIEAIKFDENGNVLSKDESQRVEITRKTNINLTKKKNFCACVIILEIFLTMAQKYFVPIGHKNAQCLKDFQM